MNADLVGATGEWPAFEPDKAAEVFQDPKFRRTRFASPFVKDTHPAGIPFIRSECEIDDKRGRKSAGLRAFQSGTDGLRARDRVQRTAPEPLGAHGRGHFQRPLTGRTAASAR